MVIEWKPHTLRYPRWLVGGNQPRFRVTCCESIWVDFRDYLRLWRLQKLRFSFTKGPQLSIAYFNYPSYHIISIISIRNRDEDDWWSKMCATMSNTSTWTPAVAMLPLMYEVCSTLQMLGLQRNQQYLNWAGKSKEIYGCWPLSKDLLRFTKSSSNYQTFDSGTPFQESTSNCPGLCKHCFRKKHELTSYYIINHNKIEMNESNQNQIIKRRPTRRLDTPEALTLVLGWYQNHKRHPPVTWMGWTRWKLNAMYKKWD